MSLNKTNNYSIIDIDKSCNKSTASQEQPSNAKRYNVKKIPELKKTHTNQSNTLYGDYHPSRHRQHNSSDTFLRNRYKSYDYLPTRRSHMNPYKSNPYPYQDMCNEYSDSGGDNNETSHEALQKFRKSYSYGGHKHFSSNEDLDNSRICDDFNHSSESSVRYPYRFGNFKDNHNDYHRKPRHTEFENTKYHGDYENVSNYSEIPKYRKYSPVPTFTRSPVESKTKHNRIGGNYPPYVNNNRSDPIIRKSHNSHLPTDFHSSRLTDFNNDNYSLNRKDTPNRNMLSLKSTYRKNENIPHSGTRLENHRKQIDKYCTNRSRETRFNESNNCDDVRRHNSMNMNIPGKNFRSHLPPSPKYSSMRKKYEDTRNLENNKYVRETFTTPRRSRMFSNDRISDNESCYFENCYNTNNDCTSRQCKNAKSTKNDCCASVSDDFSSSSLVVSQEKPTESIALPIKSLHSSFSKTRNLGESFSVPPTQPTKCSHSKEQNMHCRHSQKSTRHRSSNKHH